MLLTLLREKWPVGSKAKFKIIADRVKADHTYLAHICAAAKLDDLDDEDSLKQEETRQLSLSLAFDPTGHFSRNKVRSTKLALASSWDASALLAVALLVIISLAMMVIASR